MEEQNTEVIDLRAFDCTCSACGQRFIGADFPDFEYGRRILRTKGGKHLALWTGYLDPVYDEFISLLRGVVGAKSSARDEANLFDKTFGITCDPINGAPIDASQKQVCPNCGSDSLRTHEIVPARSVPTTVHRLKHSLWSAKSRSDKESEIRLALKGQAA